MPLQPTTPPPHYPTLSTRSYFLDNVAGWILELDRGKGLPFEGNYSEWLARRAARRQSEARTSANLARALDAELEFMRSNAKGQAKKGRARERKYEDLVSAAADAARSADTLDAIAIPTGPRLGDVVVEVADLCKSHGGRALLDGVSFSVPPGAVVGIVGANGVGKSTLFRMIMGQEEPDSGTIKVGETVVPMYVDQSRDALDADATVAEAIGRGAEVLSIAGRDVPVRQYASFFNFKGADQRKKVRTRGRGGARGSEPPTRGRPADPPPPHLRRSAFSPAASATGSTSPSPWRRPATCCCWTNRPTTSTCLPWRPWSRPSTPSPGPPSSSPTTARSWTGCARTRSRTRTTAASCSSTGGTLRMKPTGARATGGRTPPASSTARWRRRERGEGWGGACETRGSLVTHGQARRPLAPPRRPPTPPDQHR